MRQTRFAALLVLLLTTLSSFALSLGPEVPVTEPRNEPAPGLREGPLAATNGDGFVVVWYDRRGGASEIRAARLDRNGDVVDKQSKLVAGGAGPLTSVASDGRDYLVAYNCSQILTSDLCLARIDALTGAVLPAATIDGTNGVLASNGRGYMLAYLSGTPGAVQPVSGLLLTGEGMRAGAPFAIANSPFTPAIATNGDGYYVAWSTYAQLEGVPVSRAGVVGAPQRLTTITPSFGPGPFAWSVASNGTDYVVVWQQNAGVFHERYVTDVRVRTVSPDGTLSAARTLFAGNAWQPRLTWTGSEYLLTWTHSRSGGIAPYLMSGDDGDVYGLFLNAGGHPHSEPLAYSMTSGRETSSAAVSNGTVTLVVWENTHRVGTARIEAHVVQRKLTFVISNSAAWQQNPTVSRDQERTLLAWEEIGGPAQLSRVVLHQYEANLGGRRAGRATFDVQSSPRHQRRPALGNSLVAWVEEDPSGFPAASVWFQALYVGIGENFAPTGKAERVTSEAALGTRLLVLHRHVFHLILWTSKNGHLAAVERSLVARIGYDQSEFFVTDEPAVNPAGDGYSAHIGGPLLVAYNRPEPSEHACPMDCPPRFSVRATMLLGRSPQKSIAIAPAGASAPRVVFDGTAYVIFWSMDTGGTFAQRVSASGVPIGTPRRIHDGSLHDATLGRGEEHYVVVEHQGRYEVLRLGKDLTRIESIPFHARLAGDALIEISGDRHTLPMLTYATRRENDGASSRVVFRLIEEHVAVGKRRSVR